MVYKPIENEEELEAVGGFESRPIVNMKAGDPAYTWIVRGFSKVVVPESDNNEEFESARIILMMPAGFEDEPTFEEEHVMSLSGKSIIPGAVKVFADPDKLKETGEVWLDGRWLNHECTFKMTTISRPGDEEKGYSPMRQLKVSREPKPTERTDIPDDAAPCAGYQQPDKDGIESGGNTYSMD